jgi:ribosome-interacting GTPase 1
MSENGQVLEEKLERLKEEYSKTKYNKATNKHLGLLRAKIASVKMEIIESRKRQRGTGFFVKKTGDATVALVGFPSTGKSSLINSMCNTRSKTAQYAFTTTEIIPGVMLYKDSHIQIFDMPGLIEGAHLGAGGGIKVISAMKVADLVVFVIEINATEHLGLLLNELRQLKIHINETRPNIQIMDSGGEAGIKIDMNKSTIKDKDVETILSGLGKHNVHIKINCQVSEDDLIDLVANKSIYIRGIVALNKIDTNSSYEAVAKKLSEQHKMTVVPISAKLGYNIERLKEEIYKNLDIMTVYLTQKRDREGAMPMVLKNGSTVGQVAKKFHTEILDDLKCAYVNGKSVKFLRQRVGVDHVLEDGDRITFIKER